MAGSRKDHKFGGDWTSRKLEILAAYLGDYRKALKKQPFRLAYIDAFARTGYRTPQGSEDPASLPLFPDLAAAEPQALLDGSARLALQVQPPFDRYCSSREAAIAARERKEQPLSGAGEAGDSANFGAVLGECG